ncbi:MAG: DUF2748 family protein, partial [Rickettsiales bacterium]|nr:DUF2748 family protein [Rickettsiales bacterium]
NGDMIRNAQGVWTGRHSALDWGRAPSPKAGKARRHDVARTQTYEKHCRHMGINLIAEWERHLEFYRNNKLKNARSLLAWLKSRISWLVFCLLLRLRGMGALCTLGRSKNPATQLRRCLQDMLFNLTPDHEAYRRPDPAQHEAMQCMEALARVPQQAVKWGPRATALCMSGLYRLYYGEVVPACEKAVARKITKK